MLQMIAEAVNQAGTNFVETATRLLPRLVTAITIVLLGWLMAMLFRTLVRFVLRWLRVAAGAERIGIAASLKGAGLPTADVLIGALVFWLVWIGFLLSGIDVLGFEGMTEVLAGFTLLVPRLIVALVVLVVGIVLANFAWRATLLAAVNAHAPSPRLLGGAVRWLIIMVASAMALEQVGIAQAIVVTAFAIAFGSVMLALAIAFGIGAGGVARRVLEHAFREPEAPPNDEISHL